jgi:hypothetical protein
MKTKTRSIYDVLVEPTFKDYAQILGNDQGFNERADVINQAADGTDLNEFFQEIQATLALRNAQRDRLIDALTFRVTETIDMVGVPTYAAFEVASEYGQPVGIKGGKRFSRGYTFEFYDLAVRYTWMFLAEADRAQLQNLNNMALEADNNLLFTQVFKTVFNPTNLLGVADANIPVNVYKFYNADGEVPPPWKNNTFSGSHNHYITTGTASLTSAGIDALESDMISHGYGPQTGTKLVLWVNRQEGALIRAFRVTGGAKYDFIPSEGVGGGTLITVNGGIVGRPQGEVPGQIGTYGPWHIVEEEYIVPGYIVGLASGGANALTNPIGIREHKNPAYQGLKIIPGQRSDYPLIDSFYRRGFGVGVRQRGAGIVSQVTVSGTYTVPGIYA